MSSKDDILKAARAQLSEAFELPALDEGPWTTYANSLQQFRDTLASVGGNAVVVRSDDELQAALNEIEAYRDASQICSLVPGIAGANVAIDDFTDPHQLERIDFAVGQAEFGVAENGAVWVTGTSDCHKALYFITQHLAIVVPAREIVDNMHQAYQRITFGKPGFGVFISGPSKTADIEQSLVIGAHGSRSLTVFLRE